MPTDRRAASLPAIKARLGLLAAALLFSTGGAAIKAVHLTGAQVACFRAGIAALALFAMLPRARRLPRPRDLAVGVAYSGTMICFVLANKLTTAASSIYLQETAPLYLLLLGPWLLAEPVRRRDLVFMGALAAGLGMFFVGLEHASATAPDPLRGNLFALLSGLCWALTMAGFRFLGREGGSAATAAVGGNVIAFLVCLPFALPVAASRPADWAILTYLGVFQIGLAYVFVTTAVERMPALEASLLLLLEPVLNPVWAWLAHGERPSPWSLGGGAVILVATLVKGWIDFRSPAPARMELAPIVPID